MREILFKAKRFDNGEWVEGLLWKKKYYGTKWWISCFPDEDDDERRFVVDSETVCQYTGLKDKNGVKVFEGDIVKDNLLECKLLSSSGKKPRTGIAVVKYGDHEVPSDDPFEWGYAFGVYFEGDTLFPTPAGYGEVIRGTKTGFEVIGNIFDNPELLKGGAE